MPSLRLDRMTDFAPRALRARLLIVLALGGLAGCAEGSSSEENALDARAPNRTEAAADAAADASADAAPTASQSCAGRTGATGDRTLSVSTADGERTALLHVPDGHDATEPAPLVLNFHGGGSNAYEERLVTGLDEVSNAHGFLVVYPEGLGADVDSVLTSESQVFNSGICCNQVDDVAFVEALIDQISAEYCVDPKRVYATGISAGGMFSYRLACELADRIAAIAPVAAGMLVRPIASCSPSRPVPVLHIHGTADTLVVYEGGPDGIGLPFEWPPVSDEIALWRGLNGCTGSAETVYEQGDARCEQWSECAQGSAVQLCTIEGGGHSWPGSPIAEALPEALGYTSSDLSASEWMIQFFEQHPMP